LIAGDGPELNKLKKTAKTNIKFLGRISSKKKYQLIRESKALIFPGEEDFGIVPVEAISQGTPVIAFDRGGAKEILKDRVTGILFDKQTKESIIGALESLEKIDLQPNTMIKEAQKFSAQNFQKRFKEIIKNI